MTVAAITAVITVLVYRHLRRYAEKLAQKKTPLKNIDKIIVEVFGSTKLLSKLSVAIASWFLFVFLQQLAGVLIIVVPPPAAILTMSVPGI